MSVDDVERVAPMIDQAVAVLAQRQITASTTFTVAVAVDNDLYTFNSGDSVVTLFRPTEPAGRRLIHLTERDQAVVELFKSGEPDLARHGMLFGEPCQRGQAREDPLGHNLPAPGLAEVVGREVDGALGSSFGPRDRFPRVVPRPDSSSMSLKVPPAADTSSGSPVEHLDQVDQTT